MKILIGAGIVICAILGAALALALVAVSIRASSAESYGNRAVVVHANGHVDIDWRAVPYCREPICLALLAARSRGCN